jgi:hypothetical protein
MSDYIHLTGADDVVRGGHIIQNAATDMCRAASSIDSTMAMFLQKFDELISRLEAIVESNRKVS